MTFLVIDHGRVASLATNDALVAAADIAAFDDARRLFAGLDAIVAAAAARGHAEGVAAGRAVAAAEQATALLDLEARAAAARAELRTEAAGLAVAITRHIAAGIGPAATVAALAATAAAALAPDTAAEARVHPDAVAATVARLGDHPQITVVADAGVPATDCIIVTALGSIGAGLDTQLAAIAAALAAPGVRDAA